VLQHRAVFLNALRGGDEIRRRIFDTIEKHHAHEFGDGRAGIELYEELLYALRDGGMPEVMKEFERRFSPFLSPSPAYSNANLGPRKQMTDQDQDVIRWMPLRRLAVEQLIAKARASLEPISAAIARIRAAASEITTAVNDRPRSDWRRPILYVAAFSSIAMLGVFVICTSFVRSPDVVAQAVNGGSSAGAPQAQRPPTSTSKLLQPNHDPKEVGSPPSPANVTPSEGSRQPVVPAVPEQIEAAMASLRAIKAAHLEIEAAQRRPALSSDDTYLVERDLSEPISFDRPSSSSRRPGRSMGLY